MTNRLNEENEDDLEKIKDISYRKNFRIRKRAEFFSIIYILFATVYQYLIMGNFTDSKMMKYPNLLIYYFLFYIIDQSFVTERGLSNLNSISFGEWINYSMSTIVSTKFVRFIATCLLELYISEPITNLIVFMLAEVPSKLSFTAIKAVISIIILNICIIPTRFNWVYPDPDLDNKSRITSYSMGLLLSISACGFVIWNWLKKGFLSNSQTIAEYTNLGISSNYFLPIGICGILTFYGLNNFGMAESKFEEDETTFLIDNKTTSIALGYVLFFLIIIIYFIFFYLGRRKLNINMTSMN